MEKETVLEIVDLQKLYPLKATSINPFRKARYIRALDGVSFSIYKNEILGLAGESGCGKTTIGSILAGLYDQTGGTVYYRGQDVSRLTGDSRKVWKHDIQMIFQDPFNSLNPRFTVYRNVAEPLRIRGLDETESEAELVSRALEAVELRPADLYLKRYPHQLSGGQRQRVSLARCVVARPKVIIADEPVSMLDVSIRASFLELLKELQQTRGLNVVYISHNLSEIRYISQRMAVVYLGKLAEIGPTETVIDGPKHPYTKRLISAVPIIDPDRKRERTKIEGVKPDLWNLPPGCRYQSICPKAFGECRLREPELLKLDTDHYVACHLYK